MTKLKDGIQIALRFSLFILQIGVLVNDVKDGDHHHNAIRT